MPPSQTRDEYKKPKEMTQKMKRCGTPRKNKFFSLSRKKENSIRTEMKTGSLDRNIKIPKQNSNARTLLKNVKYLQEIPANKMKTETHKDNTFLRAFKNNMNAENAILNLESRGKTKKCNTENCICYCKEENCFSKSSMKNSSEILSSSRKDKLEKINHERAKDESTKSNVLHQTSPLYHKSFQGLRVPNLINSFPTFYQERIHPMNIPRTILYEKTPNILPYIIRNEKKFDNIPLISFENRPNNFLLKSNAYNQYQPIIHRNSHPCPHIVEKNRVGSPMSTTSSSTNYIGATIRQQTESESMRITGKDEKHFLKLTTETPNNYVSINSETETNFYPSYSNNDKTEESNIIDFSNLDGTMYKLEDSTEKIKGTQKDDFSKLTPFFTNYVDKSRTSSIIYPSIMHNEKLINMEECIKLFGRDVCVLSVTSSEILGKQVQKNYNNINEYSTIRIPEYIMQISTKEGTTLTNNVNYWDKFKTIDMYGESKSSTNKIKTSNVDSNEYLESTNTELNIDTNENFSQEFYQYGDSIKQTHEPNNDNYNEENYDDTLFNIKENTHTPMKKSMDQITDKTITDKNIIEIARNTLLGKSKSHVKSLLNPNKEASSPTSSEKYLYSTNSYEYSNNEELDNLKIDQQTVATLADINVNSWSTLGVLWNTLRKEEPTTIIYDLKTEYNFEEENKNYLKESNMNSYPDDEISQEQFREEDTTINYNLKIGNNFKEEIINKLNESKINTSEKEILEGQFEEFSSISYDSKTIYNSEEEDMYNLEKLNISFDPEKEMVQEQLEEKIIPIGSDSNTEYNFEETTTENGLLGKTIYLGNEILREQPTTQYLDHEKTNYLNDKEDVTNSPETTIDLPSKILSYCDDTLLLNSIRKVINDFTSNTSLTETKDLDENILQIQDRSLLPEILQIPNFESILSIPQIENTIVEKVKDALSDITAISKRNFTSDRSANVINNSFHNILQTLSANFHQKHPPMTAEEHQFKGGQWAINPITLTSIPDSKLSEGNPVKLEKNIKNLLNSSAIALQADQYVQNMQSVKNSLTKDEYKEIDNSIIHVLSNIFQTLKDSEDTNMLEKNNRKYVNLTFSQETSAENYEEGINIDNSILTDKQSVHIQKNTKINNEKMQMMSYQDSKALENNASMIISNLSDSTEYKRNKSTDIEEETRETIHKTEKNIRNQILNRIQKIDTQDDEKKELAEALKTTVTYHKAISQNNLSISAIPVESNLIKAEELNKKEKSIFLETTTISPIMTKNFDQPEKEIVTLTPRIKNINVNNDNVNNDNNKSSINYYSLDNQVLKYIKNYRVNEENVRITTMPTNFIQKTLSNYAQISNSITLENMEEVKDIENKTEYILNREMWTKSPDNLISSTDAKYQSEKSKIASSTDEIDPAIILERIEHNLSPIKYYSPEILKYIKNHHNANAFISFMQETLPDAQMSDGIISQNITSAKNVKNEIECILNEKTSTVSTDNVISSLNVDYENYKTKITPSIDKDILDSQQQDFMTKNNIIAKIDEATTEVQRMYAKTAYFKIKPSGDNNSRINMSSSVYEADANSNDNKDKNNNNDNNNLIGNKMYNADIITNDDIITETNNVTISSFKSCLLDDIDLLQPLSSLIASELEKSQLYYISDSMRLPLEIRKLKDGSYVLSITKNVCEQRKCSCSVPLQGHVILWNKNQDQKDIHMMTSSQEDMYVNNDKRDYYPTESPNMITIITTGKNILKTQKLEEEKKMSAHYHWKQNLNDNNLITILMPVIDCAKKYNLFFDFSKEKMLFNETGSHDIIQNYDKSLIKSVKKFEYDKLEKKDFNNNFERKENEFASENKDATDKLQNSVNFRERKDIKSTNFSRSPIFRDFYDLENSVELESQKKNAKANQFEIIEDLHKFKTEKDIQNINTKRIIKSKNKKKYPLFKTIDISKEDTEINNKKIKSDKYLIADIEKGNHHINFNEERKM